MRSITTLDLQYAHRFYGFKGEAQYLHGHTGVLTIEVEDTVEEGVNMVFPCNEIQKTAWEVLKNFDHALILREDDPLLPAIPHLRRKSSCVRRTDRCRRQRRAGNRSWNPTSSEPRPPAVSLPHSASCRWRRTSTSRPF